MPKLSKRKFEGPRTVVVVGPSEYQFLEGIPRGILQYVFKTKSPEDVHLFHQNVQDHERNKGRHIVVS